MWFRFIRCLQGISLTTYSKMSVTAEVLEKLQQNAVQAGEMVAHLKAQLAALNNDAAVAACRQEEVQLERENTALGFEVEALKQKLVSVECRNGWKQFSLPVVTRASKSTVPAQTPSSAQAPTEAQAQAQAQAPAQANQESGKTDKKDKKWEKKDAKKQQPPAAPANDKIDVSRLDMRVGLIVSAKKHPDADGLYVEDVDLGEENHRTIVSGLVRFVPLEQMQQRLAVFLVNLKPAKMRGIVSEGMIMCGSSPEVVEIINLPEGACIGDKVLVPGYPGTPDLMMNPKKKIWEQVQPDLRISPEGVAIYKGAPWQVEGKDGHLTVPTMRDTIIK